MHTIGAIIGTGTMTGQVIAFLDLYVTGMIQDELCGLWHPLHAVYTLLVISAYFITFLFPPLYLRRPGF